MGAGKILLGIIIATGIFLNMSTFGQKKGQKKTFLEYQKRENRFEGLKKKSLSSSEQILLLSMKVDYQEAIDSLKIIPDTLKLKLLIENPEAKVNVTVREIYDIAHYFMDNIDHQKWDAGWRGNTFEWPTDIIRQVNFRSVYEDLGVVARIDKPFPQVFERVAPVIFYHSDYPKIVDGYIFTFKTYRDASIKWSIYEENHVDKASFKKNEPIPVYSLPYIRVTAELPFVFRWKSEDRPEGFYRLNGTGKYLRSKKIKELNYNVIFYHKPNISK